MASPIARNIVRNIIGTSPRPLTTKEIFDLAGKKFPNVTDPAASSSFPNMPLKVKPGYTRKTPPQAPRLGHPISSMHHLKSRVLTDLVARSELQKVHVKRTSSGEVASKGTKETTKTVDTWVWQLRAEVANNPIPESPTDPEPPVLPRPLKPRPKTHAEMYPQPAHVHLNSRRRAARVKKIRAKRVKAASLKLTEESQSGQSSIKELS